MIGTFFSYFVVFFIVARLVSLSGKLGWTPTLKNSVTHDAILAAVLSLVVAIIIAGNWINFA